MSTYDLQQLQQCIRLIEVKLQWRPAEEWRNYEFTELSEKILDATGVRLSSTTLKRVFGKLEYNSLPSTATLNALASFVGYSSWMEFKSRPQKDVIPASSEPLRYTSGKRRLIAISAASSIVVSVAVIFFVFLSGYSTSSGLDRKDIVFTSRPLVEGLPNTVVFNLDLKGIRSDNIKIQQYWDPTKTISVKQGQKEATGFYYRPGYFRAKLLVDGKIIREHDLFIKSQGWMATIDHEPVPTYIDKKDLLSGNGLEISEKVLKQISESDNPVFLTYHLVQPFGGLQSDDFTLEARMKNTYDKGMAVCKSARILILCTRGAFIIPFSIKGCVSEINLMLNDKYLGGKENDLSAFGVDLSEVTDVKVQSSNRKISIYVGGKLIYSGEYDVDAGEVVGMRVSFLGAGKLIDVKMKNNQGIVYQLAN